jgi:hypothetical protein
MAKSVSLESMFRELDTFVPCSKYFKAAASCKLTAAGKRDLKYLVQGWSQGAYDEDPDLAVDGLVRILNSCAPLLYTEADMRKAHEFGSKYTKGTIAEAQEFRIEKLLK